MKLAPTGAGQAMRNVSHTGNYHFGEFPCLPPAAGRADRSGRHVATEKQIIGS